MLEDYYKKYNKMKKDLQTMKKKASQSQQSTSPSQQIPSQTVQYVKSPSNSQEKVKEFFEQGQYKAKRETRVKKATLSEVEELKAILGGANHVFTQGGVTEDEFWLDDSSSTTSSSSRLDSRAYASQPLPSSHSRSPPYGQSPQSSTQLPKRLILGGPIPLKRSSSSNRFNPFSRRHRLNQQTQELLKEDKEAAGSPTSAAPLKRQQSTPRTTPREPIVFDDEDDEMIEINDHKENPFRHYDPSLFHWEDANFSVGPGFFLSDKVSTSFAVPFLRDPARCERVRSKLEKGTLGEPTKENFAMEVDFEDDVRAFIEQNAVKVRHGFIVKIKNLIIIFIDLRRITTFVSRCFKKENNQETNQVNQK